MQVIQNLVAWVISLVGGMGYLGIFILMAMESSVIPVPAEIVLIPAGYLVFTGQLSFWIVLLIGTAGSFFGSFFSYYAAYLLGRRGTEKLIQKYGKVAFITQDHLDRAENYFKKHGPGTIFIARFIPVIRHVISLPAGFSKMNFSEFTLFTVLGAGIFNAFLIALGYFAGQNSAWVMANTNLITIILLVVVAVIIWAYVKFKKKDKFSP